MTKRTCEFFQTRAGYLNAKIGVDKKILTLHATDPVREARRIMSKFSRDVRWVLIAGLGLAYLADLLLKESEHEIIVFEHDDYLFSQDKAQNIVGPILSHPRVHLIRDSESLNDFLVRHRIKELSFHVNRAYYALYPEIYHPLESQLITFLTKQNINQATILRFRKVWLKNLIKNSVMYFRMPGLSHLRHHFVGKPAVIVGAGPSLNESLPILKQFQKRLCIVSTDTAFSMLMAFGIKPDFTLSVDPQNKNSLFLLQGTDVDSVLVLEAAASFLAFSKSKISKKVFFDSPFAVYQSLLSYWGAHGTLESGGSVSTNAFDFARFLQVSSIMLVGQDLAFTHSETHAAGNLLENFLYNRINRLETYEHYNVKSLLSSDQSRIADNSGRTVLTDRKFLTFLQWFQKEIKNTNVSVYNAAKYGASIPGAKYLPLCQWIEENAPNSLNKEISFDYQTRQSAAYEKYLRQLSETLEILIRESFKAQKAAQNCLADYKLGRDVRSHFEVMSRFDRQLLETIKNGSHSAKFLELAMQNVINNVLSDESVDNAEKFQDWIRLYSEARENLLLIRHLVRKAMKLLSNDGAPN